MQDNTVAVEIVLVACKSKKYFRSLVEATESIVRPPDRCHPELHGTRPNSL